ncbi:hypothetical protein ISG33_11285 [Glaciecola sp. MH2013]|nr:hypothetical protein [Glaciecola sp. MH2013]
MYYYNLSRFISVDPIVHGGSQGINPYSHILNNPLAGTDPTGYKPEIEEHIMRRKKSGSRSQNSVKIKVTKENGKVSKIELSSTCCG